jgi:cytochrome P450
MGNLLTMLIAGEDTTAFTLAWAIHQLCDSPQWAPQRSRPRHWRAERRRGYRFRYQAGGRDCGRQ